jgi:hypothetical protein
MAVVYPYVKNTTWADGSGGGTPDTAAKKNIIEDGIFNAHNAPAVRVFHNANQSITTATETALAFNSERFDQAGGAASTQHDNTTNNSRLTCLYAGIYAIEACIEWATNATGERLLVIRHSVGPTAIARSRFSAGAASIISQTTSCHYALAVNEYVEVTVYQNSGGNLNVTTVGNHSPEFSMVRVG